MSSLETKFAAKSAKTLRQNSTDGLAQHGYDVLRFWNNDVLFNLEGILQTIAERLSKAPSPGLRFAKPDLSPKGRGEAC